MTRKEWIYWKRILEGVRTLFYEEEIRRKHTVGYLLRKLEERVAKEPKP